MCCCEPALTHCSIDATRLNHDSARLQLDLHLMKTGQVGQRLVGSPVTEAVNLVRRYSADFTACCFLALLALLCSCSFPLNITLLHNLRCNNFIILFHLVAENDFTASFLLHFCYKRVDSFSGLL